jgi:hypothetical protein
VAEGIATRPRRGGSTDIGYPAPSERLDKRRLLSVAGQKVRYRLGDAALPSESNDASEQE